MDYELYHDESLEGGYWHGMLLVPVSNKQKFSELLTAARNNTRYLSKIGIKDIKKKGVVYNCASAWTQIGVVGLRSSLNGVPEYIFLGARKMGGMQYERVDLHGLKFILFRERESHKELKGYTDYASKIETTFRFGLKGGLHFLGTDENPISITKIHFDGHEHYHRNVDKNRILSKIYGLRDYCQISDRDDLIDDRRSNHDDPKSQEFEDCQFLQLTDILIGCFRTALGYKTRDVHVQLALPVKRRLLNEYNKGYKRMKNSRWSNSFVLSQCYLMDDGNWKFEPVERNQIEGKQLELPFV